MASPFEISGATGHQDEDPLLEQNILHTEITNVSNNNVDEMREEYLRIAKDDCVGLECCNHPCSYHCASFVLTVYWITRAILIILIIILYLCDIIHCDSSINIPIIGDCNGLDSLIITILALQILCIFVCTLALISLKIVSSVLLIPIILYCCLMIILAFIQFFVSLMSTLWGILSIFVLIAVGLEWWAFYKTCIIVKTKYIYNYMIISICISSK